MHKTAFVVLAALALSACATIAPTSALNPGVVPAYARGAAAASIAAEAAPVEPTIAINCATEAPRAVMTIASPALSRRSFGPPTRNQPDLRLVLATATDRARFRRGRRRAGRIAPIRDMLLTS